jgi:hypothetical protein
LYNIGASGALCYELGQPFSTKVKSISNSGFGGLGPTKAGRDASRLGLSLLKPGHMREGGRG